MEERKRREGRGRDVGEMRKGWEGKYRGEKENERRIRRIAVLPIVVSVSVTFVYELCAG